MVPNPPFIMPSEDRHAIWCLYCHKQQEVGRRAMSITCKFCNKALKLEGVFSADLQKLKIHAAASLRPHGSSGGSGAVGWRGQS